MVVDEILPANREPEDVEAIVLDEMVHLVGMICWRTIGCSIRTTLVYVFLVSWHFPCSYL